MRKLAASNPKAPRQANSSSGGGSGGEAAAATGTKAMAVQRPPETGSTAPVM